MLKFQACISVQKQPHGPLRDLQQQKLYTVHLDISIYFPCANQLIKSVFKVTVCPQKRKKTFFLSPVALLTSVLFWFVFQRVIYNIIMLRLQGLWVRVRVGGGHFEQHKFSTFLVLLYRKDGRHLYSPFLINSATRTNRI